jgi:hypothetical protein
VPPRDPRAGIISHSHQKLHRSLADTNLRATRTTDVREAAPPQVEGRSPRTAAAVRSGTRLRAAVVVLSLLLASVIGYGYLAMRQNHIPARQLPGAEAVVSALRGPVGTGFRRSGATLEAIADRTAKFLANAAARFDNWRKSR